MMIFVEALLVGAKPELYLYIHVDIYIYIYSYGYGANNNQNINIQSSVIQIFGQHEGQKRIVGILLFPFCYSTFCELDHIIIVTFPTYTYKMA